MPVTMSADTLAGRPTERERLIAKFDQLESSHFARADGLAKQAKAAETEGYIAQHKAEKLRREIAEEKLIADATTLLRAQNDRLVQALEEASDLLAERKYGSPARSPAHNARNLIDAALLELRETGPA
jgi:hypothetical protein